MLQEPYPHWPVDALIRQFAPEKHRDWWPRLEPGELDNRYWFRKGQESRRETVFVRRPDRRLDDGRGRGRDRRVVARVTSKRAAFADDEGDIVAMIRRRLDVLAREGIVVRVGDSAFQITEQARERLRHGTDAGASLGGSR